MPSTVYLDGRCIRLDPAVLLGSGGEADVYSAGGLALKVFKQPDHPDIPDTKEDREIVRQRLQEKAEKLRCFPSGLPPGVIAPVKLLYDRPGKQIVGYAMPLVQNAVTLLRYGERSYREGRISGAQTARVLLSLHRTVEELHRRAVIIGDFNDLNVLAAGDHAYLVDTDSFQFSRFLAAMFTDRFVDPRLCDPAADRLILVQPYREESDWYSFSVMAMRSLLYVDPYGGVYKPRNGGNPVNAAQRPLRRITVFHPDVRYPKPALPLHALDDEMLHYLEETLVRDRRGPFPEQLLEPDAWSSCPQCGLEHTRRVCPNCAHVSPNAFRRVLSVRGEVSCTTINRTGGLLLHAALRGEKPVWVVYEQGVFRRETAAEAGQGPLLPGMQVRALGPATLMAHGERLVLLKNGRSETLNVARGLFGPLFHVNEEQLFYVSGGILHRRSLLMDEPIGTIIPGQAAFWAGEQFGFGFYRAEGLTAGFVFGAKSGRVNDTLRLPWLRGHIIACRTAFSGDKCWFYAELSTNGQTEYHLAMLNRKGAIEGCVCFSPAHSSPEAEWLPALGGFAAAGKVLLGATDEGIIRIEEVQGRLTKTREYPDTESFVSADCRLFCGAEGLYVWDRKEIRVLKLK